MTAKSLVRFAGTDPCHVGRNEAFNSQDTKISFKIVALTSNVEECDIEQSLGTLRGCSIPEKTCMLCGGGNGDAQSGIAMPETLAESNLLAEFMASSLSCEHFEAFLHGPPADSEECTFDPCCRFVDSWRIKIATLYAIYSSHSIVFFDKL